MWLVLCWDWPLYAMESVTLSSVHAPFLHWHTVVSFLPLVLFDVFFLTGCTTLYGHSIYSAEWHMRERTISPQRFQCVCVCVDGCRRCRRCMWIWITLLWATIEHTPYHIKRVCVRNICHSIENIVAKENSENYHSSELSNHLPKKKLWLYRYFAITNHSKFIDNFRITKKKRIKIVNTIVSK